MRLALLSDLHGNAIALEAVLDRLSQASVDQIICLGDVATLGPSPGSVLERLANLGCVCIRGNHDDFLLQPGLIQEYTHAEAVVDDIDCCRQRLSRDELAFLGTFVPTYEVTLEGVPLLFFHGTPQSNTENLLATTAGERLDEIQNQSQASLLVGGHTHVQLLRQHRGSLFINPGSVGQPFLAPAQGQVPTVLAHAQYALVDLKQGRLEVTLCRIDLDPGKLRAALEAWDSPMRAFLEQQYR